MLENLPILRWRTNALKAAAREAAALQARDEQASRAARLAELLELAISQRTDAAAFAAQVIVERDQAIAKSHALMVELATPAPVPEIYTDDLYEKLFSQDSIANKRFYNFGSGDWRHPYWSNVDYDSNWYKYPSDMIDIHWDIVSGKPVDVESNSAELVYCSHTVEHLLDEHVHHMLCEAYRVLKPGGVIRVTTPNAALFYWAYKRRDAYFNFHYGHSFPFGSSDRTFSIPRMSLWVVNEIASQLIQGVRGEERYGAKLLEDVDTIDRIFEESATMEAAFTKFCGMIDFDLQREVVGHHVNWWTNEKLVAAYNRAGFKNTVPNVVGGSVSPVMRNKRYFDLVDPTFSIFVDAIK